MQSSRFIMVALCATTLASACAHKAERAADVEGKPQLNILVFGDSGYSYDWLDKEDHAMPLDARSYIIAQLDDWIEDKRPIEEFRIGPMHLSEQTGGYVYASGLWPVARAMQTWCETPGRCDLAVMLGDNIYPSGATLGTDGRDDADRFGALLHQPYIGLQQQNPDFLIYPVLGNHDWDTSRGGAMAQLEWMQASPLYQFPALFYRSKPSPDVELFAIDTTLMLAGHSVPEVVLDQHGRVLPTEVFEQPAPWELPVGAERDMLSWLEQALRESDARWKIVVAHHPLWSSSGGKYHQAKVLRELLMPTLCRYADAWLAGHEHTLEVHTDDCRTVFGAPDTKPLVQLVSGAAGKQRPLNTLFMTYQDQRYPQKETYYARGQLWGFAGLQLGDETGEITLLTTPDSGTGEPQVAFRFSFERRSGRASLSP